MAQSEGAIQLWVHRPIHPASSIVGQRTVELQLFGVLSFLFGNQGFEIIFEVTIRIDILLT